MFFVFGHQDGIFGNLLSDGHTGSGENAGGDALALEELLPHLGDHQASGFFNFYPHCFILTLLSYLLPIDRLFNNLPDLSSQDGITQIERPDHDAQDDLPPYQVGVANSEQPTGKPESTEKST
jgi:hypothetical protein